jgi:hypothetical protein
MTGQDRTGLDWTGKEMGKGRKGKENVPLSRLMLTFLSRPFEGRRERRREGRKEGRKEGSRKKGKRGGGHFTSFFYFLPSSLLLRFLPHLLPSPSLYSIPSILHFLPYSLPSLHHADVDID